MKPKQPITFSDSLFEVVSTIKKHADKFELELKKEKLIKLKRRFIKIKDLKLSYLEGGLDSYPPLIFFHGIFASAYIYRKVLNKLSRHFHVYAIDVPCFGRSQIPKKPLFMKDYSKIMRELIRKLKIKNPILIGHSAGGLISLQLALDYPRLFSKLILTNSAGLKINQDVKEFYMQKIFKKDFKKIQKYNIWKEAVLSSANTFKLVFHPVFWEMVRKNTMLNYENKLKSIKIPSLIIWTTEDNIFSIDYAKKFKKLIPYSKLIIMSGEHGWMVRTPKKMDEVLLYIKDFSLFKKKIVVIK